MSPCEVSNINYAASNAWAENNYCASGALHILQRFDFVNEETFGQTRGELSQQVFSETDVLLILRDLRSEERATAESAAVRLHLAAAEHPEILAPFSHELLHALHHDEVRVRIEVTTALARLAEFAPKTMSIFLPVVHELLCEDPSMVVRDKALEIFMRYAKTGRGAAEKVFPYLRDALLLETLGKQTTKLLGGIADIAHLVPRFHKEILALGGRYASGVTSGLRNAAEHLLRVVRITKSDEHASE